MGSSANFIQVQVELLPPSVGTGSAGSYENRSGGSPPGGSIDNVPSPYSELARPPLCRKKRVNCVRASGHSCSNRQRFSPITNSLIGGSDVIPVSRPFSQ